MGKGLVGALIAYLDTQVVVWLAQGAIKRIPRKAQALIEKAHLLMSPIVLLELEYLYEVKRTKLPSRDVYLKVSHELGVQVCDHPFPLVATVATGESWTRDPFDRLIVAQAKANGLAFLVSSDDDIAKHYLRTVW